MSIKIIITTKTENKHAMWITANECLLNSSK